ncbi:MAG: hypothetical protein BGO14_02035 [Chlamydiales bacterium 38-26]|nr:BatD family protein [Chlamydiales bacterium]OJV08222.1 MAG: hypothetical protein BGO14_02035 [Chlamydiales bacterium 38-26]
MVELFILSFNKRLIYLLFSFLIVHPFLLLAWGDVSINASLDNSQAFQGWPIPGTLEVTHNETDKVEETSATLNNKPLKINLLRNVKISPDSPLMVSIYQFSIPSQKQGTYTLSPINLKVNGKNYQTLPISYEVKGPVNLSSQPTRGQAEASLKLEALIQGPKELYPGQMTKLVYRYIYRGNIALSKETLPMLEAQGLERIGRYEIQNLSEGETSVFEISQQVQALNPGDFSWGPSLVEGVVYVEDALGNKQFTSTTLSSEAPPVHVLVKPFPLEGQPASFKGAFGKFTIKATLMSPAQVSVGDPLVVDLEISGKTSNWDRVSLPEICCQPGFSGLFKLSDLPSVGKLQENSKNFTVVLNPLSSAVAQIPAIQFSYFDPEKERYQVIDTKALPVSVSSQDMIELRSVAPLPVKTTSGPVDWIKIYQSLSPLEPQKMFVLTTRDLNNLFLGSWKILGLIPLLAILTLAQMVLKKVLKQSEKKDRQTSQDLYTELQKMSFDSLGFFELYKKIFMVRLKEKGLIVDRDMSYEDLPLTGIEGEVRSILKEIDALRYSGSYLETGDLKKAYEKGLVLYKKL